MAGIAAGSRQNNSSGQSDENSSGFTPTQCQTSFNCDGSRLYDTDNASYHEYGKSNDDRIETSICSGGISGCNAEDVGIQLIRNAAPGADGVNPVSSTSPTSLPLGVGEVTHVVDTENNRVINITRDGHIFEHGYVIRSVVQRDGTIYIRTYGEGINTNPVMSAINGFAGRTGFRSLDNRIRGNILKRSPEGRKILFNEKINNINVP